MQSLGARSAIDAAIVSRASHRDVVLRLLRRPSPAARRRTYSSASQTTPSSDAKPLGVVRWQRALGASSRCVAWHRRAARRPRARRLHARSKDPQATACARVRLPQGRPRVVLRPLEGGVCTPTSSAARAARGGRAPGRRAHDRDATHSTTRTIAASSRRAMRRRSGLHQHAPAGPKTGCQVEATERSAIHSRSCASFSAIDVS